MSLETRFLAAVEIIQKLPKEGPITTTNEQKLRFYGLYKQATVGVVYTERPGFFSFVERSKWDAWKSVEELSQQQAKEEYIVELMKMIEKIRENTNISEWLNGPDLDPTIKKNMQILGVEF